jgi:DNA-binding YbaB/EbfC family protein
MLRTLVTHHVSRLTTRKLLNLRKSHIFQGTQHMTKRKPPSFRGKPKGGKKVNPNNMMGQVQEMQAQMQQQQEALEKELLTVTAGGGAISIDITGHQRIKSIEIAEDLIDPEDKEMLQDMLIAAVNQAIEQSQALSAKKMEGITGNMGGFGDMLSGLM